MEHVLLPADCTHQQCTHKHTTDSAFVGTLATCQFMCFKAVGTVGKKLLCSIFGRESLWLQNHQENHKTEETPQAQHEYTLRPTKLHNKLRGNSFSSL